MNFDIGSFLEKEISKKRDELKEVEKKPIENLNESNSSEQESVTLDPVINVSNGPVHIKNSKLENALPMANPVSERLETRPKRIEAIMNKENHMDMTIDPERIGETNQDILTHVSMQCNLYLHTLLKEWGANSEKYHPELLNETKRNLFPLFVKLRKCSLESDLLISLATIVYHLQQATVDTNEINSAIESYMKLSLGNVAWPIGVTQIGIHERSAHSKIRGQVQRANVMIDEVTRLWITSIKRLISFHDWFLKHQSPILKKK
ncbi:mRNA splicing protein PRP18 NDAI_0K02630 [Naumovozyma dairenensis CBS 421]|uniref:Pre-mRNA-splicing factor 18 n=1 Tax=Naumovozyma dairenensis (strain ATCC 10597 / BCRC 20456 / CBS 421 / NBRC 0211 / NRRL Y-12639) TaxID=1071378 RepID=G0WI43_NAUDC|nr:hypothetical protein NDAI_0K02630 [Naumovozyma dairenensis CBS 421]CCD27454.1 hypothetical protein NDAI_0K02630 [Naumovozyma dairenensis CBS 421]